MKDHQQTESNLFEANQKSTSPGGLAERMAARAGFGVLKIDTSRVSSSGATIRSPVTIPPGVSPMELLESPVFLPNALSQPSPTTGKLPFLMPNNSKSTMPPVPEKSEDHLHEDSAFSFQPILKSKPSTLWTTEKGSSVVHQTQSLAKDSQEVLNLHANPTATKHETEENLVKPKTCDSMFDIDHPSPDIEPEQSEEIQNGEDSSAPVTGPPVDGYNWRKYGQKQVKNSEHPRTYYKCTHPNCPVKKKVERSPEGLITEIVYRGSHSHPLLLPNCQPSVPLSQFNDSQADGLENFSSKPGPGYNSATSQGIAPIGQFQDVHSGVLETKLSGSLITTEIAGASVMESMDVSSTLSSNEKGDRAMHSAVPSANDMKEDETDSKRRKMEVSVATNTTNTSIDMAAMTSRAAREPRIVVQTTSEVDILDDGYRWRKYGQKVVKGNPNPRSYYKCTYTGCSVRKHVERASNDLKSVITTYEGKHNHEVPSKKHNHEVPAAGNSNGHPSSGSGAAPQGTSFHRRLELPQVSIPQLSAAAAAAYGSFCPPPQLSAASGGFSFGMLPPGMAMPVPSLGNFMPAQMPGHGSPMQGCTGLMMPSGETKVNPEQLSRSPVAPVAHGNAGTIYQQLMGFQQQLMGRRPQDHQM